MVVSETFANVVEVRDGRRLFIRRVSIRPTVNGDSENENTKSAVQVVAVHGTCATQQQYQPLLLALDQRGSISADFVLYDCFGLARSPVDSYDKEAFTNEQHWKDLQAVTDRFTSPEIPTVFMGHSYGPTHILNYIESKQSSSSSSMPEVAGLILIATAIRCEHLTHADGGHPIFGLPLFLLRLLQSYMTDSFIQSAVHPDHVAEFRKQLRSENNQNDMAIARAYHTNMKWLTRDQISDATTRLPSLIVHGAHDQIISSACGEFLYSDVMQKNTSKFVMVQKAGHQVMMEQPEEVAEAIDIFLNSTINKK